jgi:hypothetical protein
MTSIEPHDNHAVVAELEGAAHDLRLNVRVALVEMAATWAVQQGLQLGYRRMTGRRMPSALDRDVPLEGVVEMPSMQVRGET